MNVFQIVVHFVFMYHRSSSRELHDTPHDEEQTGCKRRFT